MQKKGLVLGETKEKYAQRGKNVWGWQKKNFFLLLFYLPHRQLHTLNTLRIECKKNEEKERIAATIYMCHI